MLLVITDEGEERVLPLDPGTSVVVGRSADCEIRLKARSVSQHHVRIDVGEERCLWRDLGSRNGCYRNNERLEEGELHPGDVLRVGVVPMALARKHPGGSAGTAAVPAAADAEDPRAGEETPLDLSFVPAPRTGGNAPAVAVEELPGEGRHWNRKRVLLWGVIGVLSLAVVVGLLLPRGDGDAEAEAPRILYPLQTYEESLREGIALFRRGDYEEAAGVWQAAADAWRAAHPNEPRPVGSVFARIAETFRRVETGEVRSVSWADLTEDVLELVNRGYVSGAAFESFVEDLQRRFRLERRNETYLRAAEEAFAAGAFEKALAHLGEIQGGSLFDTRVSERTSEAEERLYEERVENARQAARAGAWETAISRAEQALLLRRDPAFLTTVEAWKENRALAARIDTAQRLLASTRPAEINRAIGMLEGLPVREPVTTEVPALLEKARQRLFLLQAQAAFARADAGALRTLAEQPQAVAPSTAPIFATFRRVERAMEASEIALQAEDYFGAREHWEEVLLLVPEEENVYHIRATQRLEEWSPSRIGGLLLEEAEEAVRAEEFERARTLLREANERAQVDTSELEETIKRFGKRLYTTAVNTIINNPSPQSRAEARDKLEKALACFDPTDEMFTVVKERLEKEFP